MKRVAGGAAVKALPPWFNLENQVGLHLGLIAGGRSLSGIISMLSVSMPVSMPMLHCVPAVGLTLVV